MLARPSISPIRMNKRGSSNNRPTIYELNPRKTFTLTKDFVKNGIHTAAIGFNVPSTKNVLLQASVLQGP